MSSYVSFLHDIIDGNLDAVIQGIRNNCLQNIMANDNVTKEKTPMMIACEYGHGAIVQLLMENGAKITPVNGAEYGRNCLHYACEYGHVEVVKLLMERWNVDVERVTDVCAC